MDRYTFCVVDVPDTRPNQSQKNLCMYELIRNFLLRENTTKLAYLA